MKKTRKRLGIFLAMAAVLLGAAGCSGSLGGPVTLKLTMWDAVPENNNFIAAFMKQNPNIKIEVVSIPAENYSQKLNTMAATNTAPDILLLWECDLPRFANSGKLVPLNDYIDKTKAFSESDLIPAVKDIQSISNGKIYGLPWCYASEILYYNKDMFDKAKVAYPTDQWTWDDFTQAAKKLTIAKNGKTIQWGADDFTQPGPWFSTIGAAGDPVVDSSGNMAIGDGAKKALQWQYDLVNKYKVIPAPSANSTGSDLFIAGKAAMTRAGSWMCSTYRDIKDFKWDIATLPKGERQYSSLHTGFFTISQNSKHKAAAWKFIEFCMSPAGQSMISKAYNNPSALMSIEKLGDYKVQGANGPSNWAAFDDTAQFGRFGYVLAPPGLTNDMVKKFQAAILGQTSIDQAIADCLAEAKTVQSGN